MALLDALLLHLAARNGLVSPEQVEMGVYAALSPTQALPEVVRQAHGVVVALVVAVIRISSLRARGHE